MKKIYIITDSDWLRDEPCFNKKEIKKMFEKNNKNRWHWNKIKEYTIYEIKYDSKKFDYDWWYWDFRIYEKDLTDIDNMEHVIDFDDYKDYWIICKELKKDFLYLKKY